MEKFFITMKEGEEWFYKCFGKDETFDATARTIHLWDMPALLLYINGLVDGACAFNAFDRNARR